jgi:hypothetical protein
MSARDADPSRINRLAKELGPRGLAGARRLASMASALGLPLALKPHRTKEQPTLQLDPRGPEIAWVDNFYGVAWDRPVDELRAVIEN